LGYVVSEYDNHYGVLLNGDTQCSVASLQATDTGEPDTTFGLLSNPYGAGLELLHSSACIFDSVSAIIQNGYGVAIGASSSNVFSSVIIAGLNNNPGLNLDAGSASNIFADVSITGKTNGINIGSDGTPNGAGESGNNDNEFGVVTLSGNGFGAIEIVGGSGNLFQSVTGTNESSNGIYLGLISFRTDPGVSTDTNNTVRSADFTERGNKRPKYIVYADDNTSGNTVTLTSVDPTTYSIAPCLDANGGNLFTGCGG
jgi:hypothetical protein